MDHTLTDRRGEARLPREVLRMPQATLRPGCPVDVIDLSPQGRTLWSLDGLRLGMTGSGPTGQATAREPGTRR